jgi:hypothetical protein
MHSIEVRNQFLQLRVAGWSFAQISLRLGVSKPTLIKWNRRRAARIQALKTTENAYRDQKLQTDNELQLKRLETFLTAMRQELLSRNLESTSTDVLKSMVDELEHQAERLKAVKKSCLLDIWSTCSDGY